MTRPGHSSLFDAPPAPRPLAAGLSYGAGWHHAEEEIWSSGLQAELLVDPEIFPAPQDLVLDILCFGAAPQRPVRLSSNAAASQELCSALPISLRVRVPGPAADGRPARLLLSLDRITSPFRLGVSSDERLLGLRILRVTPDLPELDFPLEITAPGVAQICLGPGWSEIEPEGVWSDGPSARLVLPRHLRQGDGRLEIEVGLLARGEQAPALEIEVASGGLTLLQTIGPQLPNGRLSLALQGSWLPGADLELEFRFKELRSPRDLGLSADPRALGLFLRRLDFTPR